MKIIHNKFIPFKGFGAMNILGLVFSRIPEKNMADRTKRHEGTHTYQQYELVMIASILSLVMCNIYASWWYLIFIPIIPFAIYALSFLIELVIPPYHNLHFDFRKGEGLIVKCQKVWAVAVKAWMDAYNDNCFEREAYMNDGDPLYNSVRPVAAWVKYIIPRKERKE
jgi:hypothetical protein